jgi:hypothetical protein
MMHGQQNINHHNDIHLTYVRMYFYLNAYNVLVKNLQGMVLCGKSGIDGSIILKKTLRK